MGCSNVSLLRKPKCILLALLVHVVGSVVLEQVGPTIEGEGSDEEAMGERVASSGDGSIVATAAPWTAKVRVWKFEAGAWGKIGEVSGPAGSYFGSDVDLSYDGKRLIVGDRENRQKKGTAAVYEHQGAEWVQMGPDFIGAMTGDEASQLGWAVAISGDGNTISLGSPRQGGELGVVDVYSWSNVTSNWTRVGEQLSSQWKALFGVSLDLNIAGTRLVVGAQVENGNRGGVHVYDIVGGQLKQVGDTLYGEVGGDGYTGIYSRFGNAVAMNGLGDRIVIGAYTADNGDIKDCGAAYVFEQDQTGAGWVEIGNFTGIGTSDWFGTWVSISGDGNIVAFSAPLHDSLAQNEGRVEVYRFNGPYSWENIGVVSGLEKGDELGMATDISADGSTLVVGAPQMGIAGSHGYTRVFNLEPTDEPTDDDESGSTRQRAFLPAASLIVAAFVTVALVY